VNPIQVRYLVALRPVVVDFLSGLMAGRFNRSGLYPSPGLGPFGASFTQPFDRPAVFMAVQV